MQQQINNENKNIVQPDIMHIKTWQSIKAKYSGTIVLLRIGEYYFAFDNDAFILSSTAGIPTTDSEIANLRCCFPALHLDNYLNKLVKADNRVAICDKWVSPP